MCCVTWSADTLKCETDTSPAVLMPMSTLFIYTNSLYLMPSTLLSQINI